MNKNCSVFVGIKSGINRVVQSSVGISVPIALLIPAEMPTILPYGFRPFINPSSRIYEIFSLLYSLEQQSESTPQQLITFLQVHWLRSL
jgi:hypothetical protein